MEVNTKLRKIKGVYKITNTVNGKCYVGSAVDVYNRGSMYRHLIKRKKLHNIHLQSSMLKYGFDKFTFELLERCSKNLSLEKLHIVEQHFINKLNPEYNKRLIVDTNQLLKHSQKTKDKISQSLKEAFKSGKKVINKIQVHNVKVSLFNLKGDLILDFLSLSCCAKFIGCTKQSVSYACNSNTHRVADYIVLRTKEFYKIKKVLNVKKRGSALSVEILDVFTNTKYCFETSRAACKFVNIKEGTIRNFFTKNKLIKNKFKVLKYERN